MNQFNWNYNPNDYHENNHNLIAEGDYMVSISNALPIVAQNGTSGLEITLDLDDNIRHLKYYIWLNHENIQHTNQTLGEFFNSFNIQPEERNNCAPWINKRGAVHVIHSVYKGRNIAKVAFCISRDQQDRLTDCRKPITSKANVAHTYSRRSDIAPNMPDEHAQPTPPQRQMEFKGFESGYYF